MKCPYCGSVETKVLDKRDINNSEITRRRRECSSCNKRFTTYERVEAFNVLIIKKDGRREQYSRDKLKKGVLIACQKRNVSMDRIGKLLDKVESKIMSNDKREIEAKKVGLWVMKELKKLDKIAYIRFASVYREFEDVTRFKEELNKLIGK